MLKTLPLRAHVSETDNQRLPSCPTRTANIDLIGQVLKVGSALSSLVIVLGIVLLFLRPGGFSAQQKQAFPHTFTQIWAGLLTLQPQAVIALGILLLIATPFMRVFISACVFAQVRDRRYIAIALIVLTILVTGFLLGRGGA